MTCCICKNQENINNHFCDNCRVQLKNKWIVYILTCSDNTLYTGMTNDLYNRLLTHNKGDGAKYTRGRTPVILFKYYPVETKSLALQLEIIIKRLSRKEKLAL